MSAQTEIVEQIEAITALLRGEIANLKNAKSHAGIDKYDSRITEAEALQALISKYDVAIAEMLDEKENYINAGEPGHASEKEKNIQAEQQNKKHHSDQLRKIYTDIGKEVEEKKQEIDIKIESLERLVSLADNVNPSAIPSLFLKNSEEFANTLKNEMNTLSPLTKKDVIDFKLLIPTKTTEDKINEHLAMLQKIIASINEQITLLVKQNDEVISEKVEAVSRQMTDINIEQHDEIEVMPLVEPISDEIKATDEVKEKDESVQMTDVNVEKHDEKEVMPLVELISDEIKATIETVSKIVIEEAKTIEEQPAQIGRSNYKSARIAAQEKTSLKYLDATLDTIDNVYNEIVAIRQLLEKNGNNNAVLNAVILEENKLWLEYNLALASEEVKNTAIPFAQTAQAFTSSLNQMMEAELDDNMLSSQEKATVQMRLDKINTNAMNLVDTYDIESQIANYSDKNKEEEEVIEIEEEKKSTHFERYEAMVNLNLIPEPTQEIMKDINNVIDQLTKKKENQETKLAKGGHSKKQAAWINVKIEKLNLTLDVMTKAREDLLSDIKNNTTLTGKKISDFAKISRNAIRKNIIHCKETKRHHSSWTRFGRMLYNAVLLITPVLRRLPGAIFAEPVFQKMSQKGYLSLRNDTRQKAYEADDTLTALNKEHGSEEDKFVQKKKVEKKDEAAKDNDKPKHDNVDGTDLVGRYNPYNTGG